jgi:hypothetical protein
VVVALGGRVRVRVRGCRGLAMSSSYIRVQEGRRETGGGRWGGEAAVGGGASAAGGAGGAGYRR